MAKKKGYNETGGGPTTVLPAPELVYQPQLPKRYHPPIGLIGCGGISASHLTAYRAAKLNIVALCDLIPERAEKRREEFFPDAVTYTDYRELLKRDDIEVVDIATHPQDREYLIPAALQAGKHVLSQKPYVLDLDKGLRFADLADKMGVTLAVNQNGRWAPYVSYTRQAINKGLLGDTFIAHLACTWNHQWIKDTPFNRVHHIVLYDFAIHWFDMLRCYLPGKTAQRVSASLTYAPGQTAKPPLLGQALVEFDGGQATLTFDAAVPFGETESLIVAGTKGTMVGYGRNCAINHLKLSTGKGEAQIDLQGKWFTDGFAGSMGELLCAIEKHRAPINNARDNVNSLAICFAGVVSAETGKPQLVGKVRKAPLKTCLVAAE